MAYGSSRLFHQCSKTRLEDKAQEGKRLFISFVINAERISIILSTKLQLKLIFYTSDDTSKFLNVCGHIKFLVIAF